MSDRADVPQTSGIYAGDWIVTVPKLTRRALLATPMLAGLGMAVTALPGQARGLPGAVGGASSGGGSLGRVSGQEAALPPAVRGRLQAAMREAIAEAQGLDYPFGAVLLDADSGQTVYRAHNALDSGDPSAFAEVAALRGAALAGIDLRRTVLVSTADPGPLGGSVAAWAGVAGIVFGTTTTALVHWGWPEIDIPVAEVVAHSPNPGIPVVGGFLAEETDRLCAAGPPPA